MRPRRIWRGNTKPDGTNTSGLWGFNEAAPNLARKSFTERAGHHRADGFNEAAPNLARKWKRSSCSASAGRASMRPRRIWRGNGATIGAAVKHKLGFNEAAPNLARKSANTVTIA